MNSKLLHLTLKDMISLPHKIIHQLSPGSIQSTKSICDGRILGQFQSIEPNMRVNCGIFSAKSIEIAALSMLFCIEIAIYDFNIKPAGTANLY